MSTAATDYFLFPELQGFKVVKLVCRRLFSGNEVIAATVSSRMAILRRSSDLPASYAGRMTATGCSGTTELSKAADAAGAPVGTRSEAIGQFCAAVEAPGGRRALRFLERVFFSRWS